MRWSISIGSNASFTYLVLCTFICGATHPNGGFRLSLASVRAAAGRARPERLARPRRGTVGAFDASEHLISPRASQPGQDLALQDAPSFCTGLGASFGRKRRSPVYSPRLVGEIRVARRLQWRLMLLMPSFSTQDHKAQSKKPQVVLWGHCRITASDRLCLNDAKRREHLRDLPPFRTSPFKG